LPQNLQSMGQANLLQATESMSGPLVAPPQEAWVRIGGGSEIAVGSKGNDGASLGLVGGTIVGGTIVGGSSIGVAAKLAVDGASEPVASHGIDEQSTCCTGMGGNRSTAGLGAHGAAGLGASSPAGASRSEHCRQRATEPVARLDLGEGGGSEIDVGGRGNDGASLGIGANCAAVLGAGVEAGVEAVPAGGLDVERAEVL
jgi:hypothetical protein